MNALQAAKMKDKKVKKASGKGTKTRTNSSSNVPGLDSKQNSNTKEEKGAEAMEGKLLPTGIEVVIYIYSCFTCWEKYFFLKK